MFPAPAEAPDAASSGAKPAAATSAPAAGAAPRFVRGAKGTHCPVPREE